MSFMVEVFYKAPSDPRREARIAESVDQFGGHLTYREQPEEADGGPVTLTYEFGDFDIAREAAALLRSKGEHVEGPMDYGE